MYGRWPQGTADNWGQWGWPPTTTPTNNWTWQTNYWYTCPQCSKLVQWGSAFCPSCGHKLIQEETDVDKLEKIFKKLDEIHKELQSLSEKARDNES